jgi:hypothetical protein
MNRGRDLVPGSSDVTASSHDKGHVEKKSKRPASTKVSSMTEKAIKVHMVSDEKENTVEPITQVITPKKKKDNKRKADQMTPNEIIKKPTVGPQKDQNIPTEIHLTDQFAKESEQLPTTKSKKPKTKLKKDKDKNEPKRAPSAYILFCNDKRAGIVEENPDVDQVEILKKMGELWREAGDDIKAKYTEKSKKLWRRFRRIAKRNKRQR